MNCEGCGKALKEGEVYTSRSGGRYCSHPSCHSENVDHPDHYQSGPIEVIEVIEAFELGFCLGNAIKYILRAGKKGDRREDLEKAIWYLKREIGE